MSQTRTAQQIAEAIIRNIEIFWNDEISYNEFKELNVEYWDEAKANGIMEQVQDILFSNK